MKVMRINNPFLIVLGDLYQRNKDADPEDVLFVVTCIDTREDDVMTTLTNFSLTQEDGHFHTTLTVGLAELWKDWSPVTQYKTMLSARQCVGGPAKYRFLSIQSTMCDSKTITFHSYEDPDGERLVPYSLTKTQD